MGRGGVELPTFRFSAMTHLQVTVPLQTFVHSTCVMTDHHGRGGLAASSCAVSTLSASTTALPRDALTGPLSLIAIFSGAASG